MTDARLALSTEPLLEHLGAALRAFHQSPAAEAWLAQLDQASDFDSRGALLFTTLRKVRLGEEFPLYLRALLAAAARGEDRGILALAALVHISAPGEAVIDAVREFSHLHRVLQRCSARRNRGEALEADETKLCADVTTSDALLVSNFGMPMIDLEALPHPRDLGLAGTSRRAFAAIAEEFVVRGTLSDAAIDHFLRLADLELRACALRATALAGGIDPFSVRHVREVLPILSAIDGNIQEMREFLSTLAHERRASLFREQEHALRHHLVREDADAVLERCAQTPELAALRRIFSALERRPLPARRIAYFVDRIYAIGDALVAAKLRKEPIDVVEATLIALEFAEGEQLTLPASERVAQALQRELPLAVRLEAARVVIDVDEQHARRLMLPLGLPRYVGPRTLEDEIAAASSIKDLVLANINNTSVLAGMLKNAKIVSTPGIVAMVVMRCRSASIIGMICDTRALYGGFANKDVPLALLKCPMRISPKTLRRFINVRYINKVDLRRLAMDRGGVRREVCDEVERYLKSLT